MLADKEIPRPKFTDIRIPKTNGIKDKTISSLFPIEAANDSAMFGPNQGAITIAPTSTAILSSDKLIITTIGDKTTKKI